MNQHDLSNAKDPDLRNSLAAMQRAAELARQTALQTNTALIMVKNGKMVRIPPDQLREPDKPHARTHPL